MPDWAIQFAWFLGAVICSAILCILKHSKPIDRR
jgi:hypothetical protein